MKHAFLPALVFAILILGCEDRCEVKTQYTYYEPVYSTTAEIRAAAGMRPSRNISRPGKIYIKDNLLLVGETGLGIHFIDNSNPQNPKQLSFLSVPGNNDMAILGNTLYADSYIDLVVFDISKMSSIKEVSRLEGFFNVNQFYFYNDTAEAFVTDWIEKDNVTVHESECNAQIQPWGGFYYEDGVGFAGGAATLKNLTIAPRNYSGIGGSMARFAINGDYLYALDISDLSIVDISVNQGPVDKGSVNLSWDIETIFPYQDKLFIGTQTGMRIMSLADPVNPKTLSVYEHVRSCDPVVVEGNYAYVTLRNGTACAGFLNQLEVLDIADVAQPKQLAVYPMTNPHGLGIDQTTLFVCDGDDGLKIFDARDVLSVDKNQLAHYKDIHAFDVIPFNKVAILIGETDLFQYDYSDLKDIKLLSVISFSK